MRRSRLAYALVPAAIGAVIVGFGPAARWACRSAAARHGARVDVESVRPAWGGIELRGVRVSLDGVAAGSARLDDVRLSLGWSGAVERVEVRGGEVVVRGSPGEVGEQVRGYRATKRSSGGGSRGGRELVATGLTVTWSDIGEGLAPLIARGGHAERGPEGQVTLGAAAVSWSGRGAEIAVTNGEVTVGREGLVRAVRAGGLDLAWSVRPADEARGPDKLEGSVGFVTAAAQQAQRGGASGRQLAAARGVRLRDRLVGLAALVASGVERDATFEIDGLHARLRHGDQTLNVGPGRLRLARDGERVVVDLVPGGAEGRSPLTLHAAVPTQAGAIEVDLRGGPVTLGSLGVHDGDFGLTDVDKGTLDARLHAALSADARAITFDGEGGLRSLSVRDERLADETIRGIDLAWRARGEANLDGSLVRIDDGEVDLGAIRLQAEMQLERQEGATRVRGGFTMPLAACESMLQSLPRALVPKVAGMTAAGTFALNGKVELDTSKLDDMKLAWDVANGCRITSVPADIDVARFRRPFARSVYDADGKLVEVVTGPGTPDWVPIEQVSPFVEAALTTTEDGGFRRHSGFDKGAIKSSIRDNLKAGKFLRGASTLSMQLAKNLYLAREKTLSRKLQETLLTMYLEQELTKDQILELYLNVVEFGPMLYGISPAAKSYFETSANDLSLGQALYLASILPNPKRQYFAADGRVKDRWMSYLHKLMKLMLERHRINEEELADGLSEVLTWHVPRSPRVKGGMSLPSDAAGDSGWLPIDGP